VTVRSNRLAHDARASLANPMFEQLDTPGIGRHMAAGSPVRVGGSARAAVRPAPLPGADTDEVLQQGVGSRHRRHRAGCTTQVSSRAPNATRRSHPSARPAGRSRDVGATFHKCNPIYDQLTFVLISYFR